MTSDSDLEKRQCTLLLFVATSAEEKALKEAALARGLPFEKVKDTKLARFGWEEYHWLGKVGDETVIAVRPSKEAGRAVMGPLGRLGASAKAIHFKEATGAIGIVQIGMAFGIDDRLQKAGDVLISSSLIPYDNRDVVADPTDSTGYVTTYTQADRELARNSLVALFIREQQRGGHPFSVLIGALLSGAARIHSRKFRDELAVGVPGGDDTIVGGEMEGAGLLAASSAADDPVWCIVKGISDFADENRATVIDRNRPLACRNAAEFVLSALVNDAVL